MISAVIPAHNEAGRIGQVIQETSEFADEFIVVDDGSSDGTKEEAEGAGARVLLNQDKKGYIGAIKTGFKNARGEIIVTMDGDGEHRAKEIPQLVKPILEDEADLVLGYPPCFVRPSERFLNWLTNFRAKVKNSSTGFRAMRRELVLKLKLEGRCICGISVLEPAALGARIAEVPIAVNPINKRRKVAWHHLPQLFHVLRWLLRSKD